MGLILRLGGVYETRGDSIGSAIKATLQPEASLTVVTQNVDDLHERAGSQDVIHLHGSLHAPRCIDCGLAYTLPITSEALPEGGSRIEPPRCSGYVRP